MLIEHFKSIFQDMQIRYKLAEKYLSEQIELKLNDMGFNESIHARSASTDPINEILEIIVEKLKVVANIQMLL